MAIGYLIRQGTFYVTKLFATAGGVLNANMPPLLDGNGRLTADMMPAGYGPDVDTLPAAGPLKAGDFVNIFTDTSGTPNIVKVRQAVATGPGFEARGYVEADVAAGGQAVVKFDDNNSSVTSATAGPVFLSATVPGGFSSTPPTGAGQLSQVLGIAISPTVIHVNIEDCPVVLA